MGTYTFIHCFLVIVDYGNEGDWTYLRVSVLDDLGVDLGTITRGYEPMKYSLLLDDIKLVITTITVSVFMIGSTGLYGK